MSRKRADKRLRAVRRAWRALRRAPLGIRVGAAAAALLALAFAVNWGYQVARKPTELFFPVSGVLAKTPRETWRQYEAIFRAHATGAITPEFLAALAQVEAAGNPVARTYWRWRLTAQPFDVYRPASSAVGMYQITDATFREASRYCIHDHAVAETGPWYDAGSCWFNRLYFRVVPSHAVEMTSAYLAHRVRQTLLRRHIANATLRQKQDLAAVIHLCGAAAGDAFARRGFRVTAGERCGNHEVGRYVGRVTAMESLFIHLARAG